MDAAKLTVVAPCYNERLFIGPWLANVRAWADAVVISEGGSDDGTHEIIVDAMARWPGFITLLDHPQSRNPQVEFWNESARRQALVDAVTEGYIVQLDIDEMLNEQYIEYLRADVRPHWQIALHWLSYWGNIEHKRVSTPGDPHWDCMKTCVWPAGKVHYGPEINHAQPLCDLKTVGRAMLKHHYHYLRLTPKAFENRTVDLADQARVKCEYVHIRQPAAYALLAAALDKERRNV